MAILLPTSPAPRAAKPRLLRYGSTLTPLVGPSQRISRLGSRFAVDLEFPPMTAAQARAFIAARLRADTLGEPLRLPFPQPGAVPVAGTPRVNGGGQLGMTLQADGFSGPVSIPGGQFFSVETGARSYLYALGADAEVNSGGAVALSIAPMLRASPADNAALTFNSPIIEGFVQGEAVEWSIDLAAIYGLSFTLFEAA